MLERLMALDRRIIFLALLIVVIIPTLLKVSFPISSITPTTQDVYDEIDGLEPGSCVWIALDYTPPAMAELQPQLSSILHHCFAKDIKVLGLNPLIAESAPLGHKEFRKIGKEHNKIEGTDYVYLGYRPGQLSVMLGLAKDMETAGYTKDMNDTPLSDIPMMKEVKSYDDANLLIALAAFKTPGYWVQFVGDRFGVRVAVGVTNVMYTAMFPYINSGQLKGVLPGLQGAAEYEHLVKKAGYSSGGPAQAGMSIQSIVHYALVLLLILCNVGYFVIRHREAKALERRQTEAVKQSVGLE
ncbi:hypothetical protein CMK21_18370 [Candidatus Poribacteria bacterium]|nr:hypothetical protein [Candidatus Poribacteria bacterium]